MCYHLPFSPLDPSAEDKAQETFARLYKEHVSTEENKTRTNTNNKITHFQEEHKQSKSEETKFTEIIANNKKLDIISLSLRLCFL